MMLICLNDIIKFAFSTDKQISEENGLVKIELGGIDGSIIVSDIAYSEAQIYPSLGITLPQDFAFNKFKYVGGEVVAI